MMSASFESVRTIQILRNAGTRAFASDIITNQRKNCKLLVVGGGTGGCSIAAKFASKLGKSSVIVVEPSDRHYYQPMFTLIGGGMKQLSDSVKPTKKTMPSAAEWIQDRVTTFDPRANFIVTKSGIKINYDFMVVAVGLTLCYNKIPGLVEALAMEDSGVCSNYSPEYVEKTYKTLQKVNGGNLLFTFPNSPVKCPGAPQKICYIAEEYLRKHGKRNNSKLIYNTSLGVIFGVKKYADALWEVCKSRGIDVNLRTNLVKVIPDRKLAVFENLDRPEQAPTEIEYSLLHVTPPMSPPDVLRTSPLLADSSGFLDVDKLTLRHKVFSNIFGIGDCTNSPNSKTAAAVAAQCGVVERNLSDAMGELPLTARYDGYASCPLVTGYSSCILAEFNFELQPLETFPINQAKERRSMFYLKKSVMPTLYWEGLLKGHWNGPSFFRNLLHGNFKST